MNGSNDSGGRAQFGSQSVESFKKSFFNPAAVTDPAAKAVAKALSKFGAFVRQRAKTSIRYREKPGSPGSPPSAHKTGMKIKPVRKPRPGQPVKPPGKPQPSSPLRDFMLFGFDREKQSVVIGPAKTNQGSRGLQPIGGTKLSVLEEGGSLRGDGRTISITRAPGRNAKGHFVSQGKQRVRLSGAVTIAPRPYMKPAFDAELSTFMDGMKDSVTPG